MQRLRTAIFLLGSLLLFVSAVSAQVEARVSTNLSSGVARLGERIVLSISVEGTSDARVLSVPSVDGLEFGALGAPSRQLQRQIVNGRVSSRESLDWKLILTPRKEGDFEIPAITLEVAGKRVSTRPQSLRVVRDLTGAEVGFLEVTATPEKVVEGQAFTVEVRFGWDAAALPASGGDAYADLSLPWWDGLPGLIELDPPEIPGRAEVLVNRRVRVKAERLDGVERNGRRYIAFRIVKRWLPTRAGTIELPQSFLEFGLVRESFFRSEKVKQLFVGPVSVAIPVVALPEAGRPFDYSGAVGDIAAKASADRRDVVVGDSVKLTVDWTGSANLEFFEAPDLGRLDAFSGFRVYGATEDKRLDRRRVVYDLAPLDVTSDQIPPVPLVLFDPETLEYRTLSTDPIPLRVRPLQGAVTLDEGLPEDERFQDDIQDLDVAPLSARTDPRAFVSDRSLAWSVLLVPLVLLGARSVVRSRRGDPGAPAERLRRAARRRLARELRHAKDDRARLAAFERFLAARTRRRPEAWEGRRAAQLAPDALADESLARVDATLENLASASWGGTSRVPDDEVLAAADAALSGGL